jgi:hypothetical protein
LTRGGRSPNQGVCLWEPEEGYEEGGRAMRRRGFAGRPGAVTMGGQGKGGGRSVALRTFGAGGVLRVGAGTGHGRTQGGRDRVSIVKARTPPPRQHYSANKGKEEGELDRGAKGRSLAGHQAPVGKRQGIMTGIG